MDTLIEISLGIVYINADNDDDYDDDGRVDLSCGFMQHV